MWRNQCEETGRGRQKKLKVESQRKRIELAEQGRSPVRISSLLGRQSGGGWGGRVRGVAIGRPGVVGSAQFFPLKRTNKVAIKKNQ